MSFKKSDDCMQLEYSLWACMVACSGGHKHLQGMAHFMSVDLTVMS